MKKISIIVSLLVALMLVTAASAQVTYTDPAYTSYQVVNLSSTDAANITVTYYSESGAAASYVPTFSNVPAGGAITVQQSMEPLLAAGRYSAVISSNTPIAAIANQQLGADGSQTSIAPFSSYSGATAGATEVTLPVIMFNWFGYYTEVYIQNVGAAAATNITITYAPTLQGTCTSGAAGKSEVVASLPQFSSRQVTQVAGTVGGVVGALGAPDAAGCSTYKGRFLGSAKVTADQPVVVIVNQVVQDKLFTYNGFTTSGVKLIAPAYMRNYYGYYASLTIANPGTTDATVKLTYRSDASFSLPTNKTVIANHIVPAGKSISLYDGASATASQSDLLADFPPNTNTRFFGSVIIESDVPVVAMVNQEAIAKSGNQAGSYNAMSASEGTAKISVPLIQSAYYGYYTSLTIMTVDGTEATVEITYTSDSVNSTVKNQSITYTLTTSGGFLNRYEGASATTAQSDILDDLAWMSGGARRFIGSAVIKVVSGSNIVAFVNSESSTAPNAATRDSMYTYNAFNLVP